MGIISSSTGGDVHQGLGNSYRVKRQRRKHVGEVIKNKCIPTHQYIPEQTSGLSKVYFRRILELQSPTTVSPDISLDLLWHTSLFFHKGNRPSWSGFMTDISVGAYPGKSVINFLPIIDLNPTDMTCIYSTLRFVLDQSAKLHIETPVLTFDQPLWLKATEIINAKCMPIVLILGGFHLMMSYLGSLGGLMNGAGLKEVLHTIYGVNAVEHVLSGKAVSRALRVPYCAS